jgi:predicted nucleic acid-binding protein
VIESKLVVDTNIFFSLLLRRDTALRRRFLTDSTCTFHCPRFFLVELFKHKERITQATELSDDELLECLYELLARVHFFEEGSISIGTWMEARRLCRDIDPKDTPFVALTLHLDGRLWTSDEELKTGLKAKGFNRFFQP